MLPVFLLSQFLRMSLHVSQRSLSPPPLPSLSPHSWLLPASSHDDNCELSISAPDCTEIWDAMLGVLEWPDPDWDLVPATLRQLRDLVSHSINLTQKSHHLSLQIKHSTCWPPRASWAVPAPPWWALLCRTPGCSWFPQRSQRQSWIFYFPDILDQNPLPLRSLKSCLLCFHHVVALHFWKFISFVFKSHTTITQFAGETIYTKWYQLSKMWWKYLC